MNEDLLVPLGGPIPLSRVSSRPAPRGKTGAIRPPAALGNKLARSLTSAKHRLLGQAPLQAHAVPQQPAPPTASELAPAPRARAFVPLHAPHSAPGALRGSTTPQAEIARIMARTADRMTDAGKSAVFLLWGGSAAGQFSGTVAGNVPAAPALESPATGSLHGLSVIAFPFAALAVCSALYDVYKTAQDAHGARQDYLSALTTLREQELLLADLEALALPDEQAAAVKGLIKSNIQALGAFIAAYENAYWPAQQRPHAATARADMRRLATEICELQRRQRELEGLIDEAMAWKGTPGTPPDGDLGRLQEELGSVGSRLASLQAQMHTCGSRSSMRAQVHAALDSARQELTRTTDTDQRAALEREIQQLKQDLKDLDPSVVRLFKAPTADLGSSQLKLLRSVKTFLPEAIIDASTATTGLITALHIASLSLASLGLSIAGALFTLGAARLDVRDARNEKASATTAKLAALRRGGDAASLYLECADGAMPPETRSCRYAVWSFMRVQARDLEKNHRAGFQAGVRYGKGVFTGMNAVVAVPLAVAAIAASNPVIAVGSAAIGAVIGAGYCGRVGLVGSQNWYAKTEMKERAAAADAFVRLFGAQAVSEFHRDAEAGHLSLWTDRLDRLRTAVEGINDDIPSAWLAPASLLENEFLNAERLIDGLFHQAMGPASQVHRAAVEVASAMAHLAGKPDPALLQPSGFATAAEFKAELRRQVIDIYGVKDFGADRLPLADALQPSEATALLVNDVITQELGALADGAELQAWVGSVSQDPENFERQWSLMPQAQCQRLRAAMAHLRETLARLYMLGPQQLHDVQGLLTSGQFKADLGLLGGPSALHWLELLADPTWMAAPPAAAAPPVATGSGLTAARNNGLPMAQLIQAVKTVGVEMRDGPLPDNDRGRGASAQRVSRPLGRIAHAWNSGAGKVGRLFTRMAPNRLATPARALQHLLALPPAEQSALVRRIFWQLLREAGGPTLVLAKDPAVVAELDPNASPNEVRKAHAVALLDRARQGAIAGSRAVEAGKAIRASDSKSMARLAKRMDDSVALCDQLLACVDEPWLHGVLTAVEVQ